MGSRGEEGVYGLTILSIGIATVGSRLLEVARKPKESERERERETYGVNHRRPCDIVTWALGASALEILSSAERERERERENIHICFSFAFSQISFILLSCFVFVVFVVFLQS